MTAGFINFFNDLQDLRSSTTILESLDWDEEKLEAFLEELRLMLTAAPPNVDKALFWLRTTPWDTFDKQLLPDNVYQTLEDSFRAWDKTMKETLKKTRKTTKATSRAGWSYKDDGWN